MLISNCVAVVAGGASGLGYATARRLRDSGAKVVVLDLPSEAARQRVSDVATFVAADVTSEEDVQAGLDIAAALGPLRILVNCAGVATPGRVIGKNGVLPLEQYARVISINLIGSFNTMRLAAEHMMRTDPVDGERGVIVNTASAAAYDGQIGQAAYSASKGGIVAMTLPVARDLADKLIRVMAIAPGLFKTPMLGTLPQQTQDSLGAQVPHPARLGEPSEYAALVEHIVTNPMLNGEVIRLDGAIRMAPR